MQFFDKFRRSAAAVIAAAMVAVFGAAGYYSAHLPDSVVTENDVSFALYPELRTELSAPDQASVTLLGTIPVKSIALQHGTPPTVIAGGQPFGIKLLMEGVMVTGLGDVDGHHCPAEDAGVRVGDVIRLADGQPVTSNADLQQIISGSCGRPVELSVSRGDEELDLFLTPAYSRKTGAWRGGMWVRDSIAGIGTMTFTDKSTGRFAGLGHPVCDSDTGGLIPIHSGEAVPVEITDVQPGEIGVPGELHGRFKRDRVTGILTANDQCGVYGVMLEDGSTSAREYPLGFRQDVTVGDAQLLTTVAGSAPKAYSVRIEKLDYSGKDTKNMVIRITDPDLLDVTGGIVQGMSGSPIIQNGRLVGAVTHVFIADPTRGYGVFADTMYQQMMQ